MSEQQEQPTLFDDLPERSQEAHRDEPHNPEPRSPVAHARAGPATRRRAAQDLSPSSDLVSYQDLFSYQDLIARFIQSQRSRETGHSYEGDLRDFFGGHPSPVELQAFLGLDEMQLVQRLSRYRDHLQGRNLSSSTVKRRITTLRSLLRFAHAAGLSRSDGRGLLREITIEASSTHHRELSPDAVRSLITAPGQKTLVGYRDTTILSLLGRYALHRSQLCDLNVADYNPQSGVLRVKVRRPGGYRESVGIALDEVCKRSLTQYLRAAGHWGQLQSPLFLNLDRRSSVVGQRLTIDGIYYLVRYYGELVGLGQQAGRNRQALNSRDLRHVAIVAALEANFNDVLKAHQVLPHISIPVLESHRKR